MGSSLAVRGSDPAGVDKTMCGGAVAAAPTAGWGREEDEEMDEINSEKITLSPPSEPKLVPAFAPNDGV